MRKLTKRITAMLLSGMLVIGSVPSSVFAASTDVDPGQTSEIAQEVFEEESSELPMSDGEMAESEDASEVPMGAGGTAESEEASEDPVGAGETAEKASAEEEAQYYTVTLDANGGYFENEWDDAIGDYVQQAEVIEKHISVGGNIATVPVFTETDQDGKSMVFAGWSMEPEGELVSLAEEKFVPVDNCVLYAVWQAEDVALGETEGQEATDEGNIEQADAIQESEEVDAEAQDSIVAEEGAAEEDTASEANNDPETEKEQDISSDQEAVYTDGLAENTSGESSDASVVEEETQPDLIEFSEEEETVREDASMDIDGEVVDSGTCGENATWVLVKGEEHYSSVYYCTLYIMGTGPMTDWEPYKNQTPWEKYKQNSSEYEIQEVHVSEGITTIGNAMLGGSNFTGSTNYRHQFVNKITLPSTIERIGDHAFCQCDGLRFVNIPNGTSYIGEFAFYSCNVEDFSIPDSVSFVGKYAFEGNYLNKLTVPQNMSKIGENAFNGSGISELTIPDTVLEIGDFAFSRCDFDDIHIPSSVTSISKDAFSDWVIPENRIITVDEDNKAYDSRNNCNAIIEKNTDTLIIGCNRTIIPDSVLSIGNNALSGCSSLTSISIPKSVTRIGDSAFSGCTSLSTIYFNGNAPTIDSSAFIDVTATAYYPANNPTWTEDVRQNYGGNITWELWDPGTDPIDKDFITDADRFLLSIPINSTIQYLYNDNNFANSCYIKQVDSDFLADWVEAETNMLFRGLDGWRDIFTDATKVEKAEVILAGLLQGYQAEVKELAEAKTAQKWADCYLDGLKLYLSAHALENKALDGITNKDIISQIQEGKFDEIVEYLKKNKSLDTEAVETLKEYHTSQYFADGVSKGLDFLDTGITIAQLTLDTVNKLYELEALVEADDIYCEMLQYLSKNCEYDVVRRAAQNLDNVIQGGYLKQLSFVTISIQNKVASEVLDKTMDAAVKAIPFGTLIKETCGFSTSAAELLFNNGSIEEEKDCMRICAFTGRTLSRWMLDNRNAYFTALNSGNESGKKEAARSFCYSLYMLAKTRAKGEESIQSMLKKSDLPFWKMSSTDWYKSSEQILSTVNNKIIWLKNQDGFKSYCSVSVSCPVDIEVYDINGNIVTSVRDGNESSGLFGEIYYDVYYNPIDNDFDKIIHLPENAGYSVKIIGTDLGKVDCLVTSINDDGSISSKAFNSIPITVNDIIRIDNIVADQQEYVLVHDKTSETKQFSDVSNIYKAVDSITLDCNELTLEVGSQAVINATCLPSDATTKAGFWTSSDESIVQINKDGIITAYKEGTADIICTSFDSDSVFDLCTVNVVENKQEENDIIVESDECIVYMSRISSAANDGIDIELDKGSYAVQEGDVLTVDATVKTDKDRIEGQNEYIGYFAYYANKQWNQLASWDIEGGITKFKLKLKKESWDKYGDVMFTVSVFPKNSFTQGSALVDKVFLVNISRKEEEHETIEETIVDSGTCGNSLTWSLSKEGTLAISGKGKMSNWTYESPSPWNKYATEILNVVIENGVTSIGNNAFYNCRKLKSVSFGETVAEIGECAFMMTYELHKVAIPDSVKTIKKSAFSCSWLEELSLGNSVERIEDDAFGGNFALTEVVFPESISYLGKDIFEGADFKDIYYCGEAPEMEFCVFNLINNEKDVTVYIPVWSESWNNEIKRNLCLKSVTWKTWNPSNKKTISSATVNLDKTAFIFTGKAIQPSISVSNGGMLLKNKTDYKISYSNNINAGTAKVNVKGTGNYYGTVTKTFKINKASQSITAKAAVSRIAVGKTTTVSITGNKGAKSFKSSDTTIATVDKSTGKVTAKKVGTVKITTTSAATDNYKASSKTVTIKVVPAATASLTATNQATGIKLTWKKVTGANGYKVYRGSTLIKTITNGSTVTFADTKANTNGTKYTYKVIAKAATGDSTLSKSVAVYRVARPAISSVTNSAASKMTVKWGKNAKATGYQIQYSTDKTFKSGTKAVTVAGASAVSKVIGSLTKSKTYYVRIRTYKTVGSAKYWSVWSAAKSVKIAK